MDNTEKMIISDMFHGICLYLRMLKDHLYNDITRTNIVDLLCLDYLYLRINFVVSAVINNLLRHPTCTSPYGLTIAPVPSTLMIYLRVTDIRLL